MRAIQTSDVYACVKILAETIASLPLHSFKKDKGSNNEMAEQHPLFSCLYEFPNEEMTSFEFRETMMTSLFCGVTHMQESSENKVIRPNCGT